MKNEKKLKPVQPSEFGTYKEEDIIANRLISIAYDILPSINKDLDIDIEFVPVVQHMVKGICATYGEGLFSIRKKPAKGNFIISIGLYTDKNGKEVRCSLWDLADTLAHELAHLKYFNHSIEHTNYTKYLFSVICKKIKQIEELNLLKGGDIQ